MKRLLVTCGLPYSNGLLHVGHIAGCYLPADIFVRYSRLKNRPVRFICGSDDHGVPIKLTADKLGKKPREVASEFNSKQKNDFASLGIHFDIYGSTCNSPYHYKTSQDMFLKLYEKGFFVKESSKQFYDDSTAMFLPDRYVKGTCGYCGAKDQNSDQCEECGKVLDVSTLKDAYSVINKQPASIKDSWHWYLDLSRFSDTVEKWLQTAQTRDHSKNFVRGLISTGLVKRAMTRDLDWGIPVPLKDPDAANKVLYVWFDAPIGYISFTQEACAAIEKDAEKYSDWWKSKDSEIIHFIGEDNTIFHCIIWIAMLAAEGSFELPSAVVVNQFLNMQFPGKEVEKMSKSRGTAIWISEYIAQGGQPDSLRYYLTAVAPEKSRTVFSLEDLVQKHNSELANALGNFVNRVLSFYIKNFATTVQAYDTAAYNEVDKKFNLDRLALPAKVGEIIEGYNFKPAQDLIFEFIREGNRYIDTKQPWSQRKTDPQAANITLTNCLNAIRTIAVTLQPFLPFTAENILNQLGINTPVNWEQAGDSLTEGHALGTPQILFTKIDIDKVFPEASPSL